MLRVALLLIFALFAIPAAHAQDGGGYVYPASTSCSPLCVGASLSWIVAPVTYSGTGAQEQTFQWIGIASNGGVDGCPGTCLGQFGTTGKVTTAGVASYNAWWELFCDTGAPCNNIQNIAGFTITPGDKIVATMECASGCTKNNAAQQWAVSLLDVTTGVTWNNSGTNFNWPLAMEQVITNTEVVTTHTANFGVARFSDFLVDQGSGLVPTSLGLAGAIFGHSGTGTNERFSTTSIPFGKNNNDFNNCYTIATTLAASPCFGGPYTTGAGEGP